VLEPGEEQTVEVELTVDSFRYWHVDQHAWRTDPGRYQLLIGESSENIWATADIHLEVD
jgi:hypothetical protein